VTDLRLSPPLTDGERLFVDRRRRGLSQTRAAKRARVSYRRWCRWEDDLPTPDQAPPRVDVGKLEPHEWARLLRRRRGIKRAEVAAALGLSLAWVTEMERGNVAADALVAYWGARG